MTTTHAEIWQRLSAVNLDGFKIEKPTPGKPVYLSWGDAWGLLMQHYPNATFRFLKSNRRYDGDEIFEALDGSAEVRCVVSIDGCDREMWLPMMDHKHNAVADPNARDVSDAKMRCLVKCLAMFGLGHALYAKAKEDIPSEDKKSGSTRRERPQAKRDARPARRDPGQSVDLVAKHLDALAAVTTMADLEDAYDAAMADAKRFGLQALLDDLPGHFDRYAEKLR